MIPQDATGAAAELPFSLVNSTTGLGNADKGVGTPWNDVGAGLTDEFKIQLPDATPGTYVNGVIAQIVNRGGGSYGYRMAAAETDAVGVVLFYPNVSGHDGSALSPNWDRIVATPSASTVAAAVIASDLEGGNTLGDMMRAMISLLGCKVTDFTTGTLVFKSIDGTKTRWTVTTDSTGRLSITVGDLT